jgi:4-hydroxybenzoate polyprenyltransferase
MKIKFEPGFARRMRVYLKDMYPVGPRLAGAFLLYLGFTAMLGRIHGVRITLFSTWTLVGTGNVFGLLLILRLMDELKDLEVDSRLFSERPVPSGRVLESDISSSLVAMIVLYLVANRLAGRAFWTAAAVLAYSLLMFRYFLIPGILRRYLLLNLATHNPIIPLMLFHLVHSFSVEANFTLRAIRWKPVLWLMVMTWSMAFAWEISRKIRSPAEENAYVTYSQILGRPGAVALAAAAQTLTLALAVYFTVSLSLSWIFIAVVAAGYFYALRGHIRFLLEPGSRTSRLRPFAELYILSILAAFVAGGLIFG